MAVKEEKTSRKRLRSRSAKGGGHIRDKKSKVEKVDSSAVFIRGLPTGTRDPELRSWLEDRIGPTVTCFMIREDYGLAKFKVEDDARRCLEELQGAEFGGSTLQLSAAKPKRPAVQQPAKDKRQRLKPTPDKSDDQVKQIDQPAGGGSSSSSGNKYSSTTSIGKPSAGLDLRRVHISGLPADVDSKTLQSWVEKKLPGGCGIETVRGPSAKEEESKAESQNTGGFVITFKKEHNAARAVETLQGAHFKDHAIYASFLALDRSRQTAKAGRLIVRNLSFSATVKHIRKAFESVGSVREVHIPTKSEDSKKTVNRGFAFVQFSDLQDAERAIVELNGSKICGRGVAIDWAVDSNLYSSLQRQDQKQQQKQDERKDNEDGDQQPDKLAAGRNLTDDQDENEEDEDQKSDIGNKDESNSEQDVAGEQKESTASEIQRMKTLLGDQDKVKSDSSMKTESASKKGLIGEIKSHGNDERKQGFDVDEGRTIFVRNIPFDASAEELREICQRFGKIQQVKLVADATGQNAHRGSAFVKFRETDGCAAALAAEAEADRRLKEFSSFVKKSDQRELPAVEGFGLSLRGRRLVLKQAVTPKAASDMASERKPQKGQGKEERARWMHLLHVGEIKEGHPQWEKLSLSERRQRQASMKERKWRINNPNFVIHPSRLSIRNLPTSVAVPKLREAVIQHLSDHWKGAAEKQGKRQRMLAAEKAVSKISLVRDSDRRDVNQARRSRGFGFIAFTDHEPAMKTLEFLNNNPQVFGGARRPIVEFAVEDKRKLRMQQELYQKNAHKLLKGKDGSQGKQDTLDKNANVTEKREKQKAYSRGRKQREKRRAQKAAAAEKEKARDIAAVSKEANKKRQAEERSAAMLPAKKRKLMRNLPDAEVPRKQRGRARNSGELADDFELRAMERFRSGA